MEVAGLLSGGAPYIQKYQINADFPNAGVPALVASAAEAGIDLPGTATFPDVVGITLDTGVFLSAQQTGAADPAVEVACVINPDAIVRVLLSGGTTEGTALTLYDVTTASTDGLDVTTGDDFTNPQFDEGAVWGYDGANAKIIRRITATSSTDITVGVAFPNDSVVGDNYIVAPYSPTPTDVQDMTLTDAFTEAAASIAVGTGDPISFIRYQHEDLAGDGRTNSYVLINFPDHHLNQLS